MYTFEALQALMQNPFVAKAEFYKCCIEDTCSETTTNHYLTKT
jgi:hypothetical protein